MQDAADLLAQPLDQVTLVHQVEPAGRGARSQRCELRGFQLVDAAEQQARGRGRDQLLLGQHDQVRPVDPRHQRELGGQLGRGRLAVDHPAGARAELAGQAAGSGHRDPPSAVTAEGSDGDITSAYERLAQS